MYTLHNGNLLATLWARWWGSKIPILILRLARELMLT
jgi:hypothetical protein